MNAVRQTFHEEAKARRARMQSAPLRMAAPAFVRSPVEPDAIEPPPSWIVRKRRTSARQDLGFDADAHVTAYVRAVCGYYRSSPTIALIIAATARAYDVHPKDIFSTVRTNNMVRPRHVAMYFARKMTGKSLPEIGRRFGGRDHTTVLHAFNKITASANEPEIARKIAIIRADVEANFTLRTGAFAP